jgi:hypothetical protein
MTTERKKRKTRPMGQFNRRASNSSPPGATSALSVYALGGSPTVSRPRFALRRHARSARWRSAIARCSRP